MTEQEYLQALFEKEMEDAMYIYEEDFKDKKPIEIYRMGYQNGREDAEEEIENRFNRVLDDEKRISYEQGKADKAEEIKCLNEIARLYIEHRKFGEYPTTKEEYADETMKILYKYKIKVGVKE